MNLNGDGDVLVDMVVNTCGLHAETCMCMCSCADATFIFVFNKYSIKILENRRKTKAKPKNTFTHRV